VYKLKANMSNANEMVLGMPFLERYWGLPLYQWMILYFGKTQGQTSCVMGSLEPVLRYMEEREQVAGLKKHKSEERPQGPANNPRGQEAETNAVPDGRHGAKGCGNKTRSGGTTGRGSVRLATVRISAQGPAGVKQVPRGNDVRSESTRRPLPKAKTAGKALRGWARTKLKRLRPHEKGSRSRVLPREIKSIERQPRKISKVSTRHTTNRRERLHMMCLMAARENRNVETEGVAAESLWEDNPEDLVTDLRAKSAKTRAEYQSSWQRRRTAVASQ
jgi:hypothetical protein